MLDPKPPPAGVDYLMAVQCAGLAGARDSMWPKSMRSDLAVAYSNWAYELSGDAQNWETVLRDIQASQRDFLNDIGPAKPSDRAGEIGKRYGSSLKVCDSLADLPDRIIVGG